MKKLVLYAFDNVELLDFCGPYEVFSLAARLSDEPPWEVVTVGPSKTITSFNGLVIGVDALLEDAPKADLFLVPGGRGVRHILTDETQMAWLEEQGRNAEILMSVCTGSWLLAKAGLVDNMKLTTHHDGLERLRELAPTSEVVAEQRFVDNGRVVVSAGISSGIDMALYMIGRLCSLGLAKKVADHMEYVLHIEV